MEKGKRQREGTGMAIFSLKQNAIYFANKQSITNSPVKCEVRIEKSEHSKDHLFCLFIFTRNLVDLKQIWLIMKVRKQKEQSGNNN